MKLAIWLSLCRDKLQNTRKSVGSKKSVLAEIRPILVFRQLQTIPAGVDDVD
jgi:hypothetical protein